MMARRRYIVTWGTHDRFFTSFVADLTQAEVETIEGELNALVGKGNLVAFDFAEHDLVSFESLVEILHKDLGAFPEFRKRWRPRGR